MIRKFRRCPVCQARHRTIDKTTRCIWRAAEWLRGHGTWALLAHCGVFTVTLWATRSGAVSGRRFIDRTGCGSVCTRHHEVVRVDPGAVTPRQDRRARR